MVWTAVIFRSTAAFPEKVRVELPAATDARTKKLRTGGSARTRG
jgi:hypothetical protein